LFETGENVPGEAVAHADLLGYPIEVLSLSLRQFCRVCGLAEPLVRRAALLLGAVPRERLDAA
jgi:hypothetical protein